MFFSIQNDFEGLFRTEMSQYSNSITHGFWISMKSYISSLILVAKLDSHQWNCTFIHFNRFEEWIYYLKRKSRNTDFVIDSSSNQKLLQDAEIYCNDWSFWVIIIEGIFENFCKNLFLEPEMDIFLPIMSIFLKHNMISARGVLTEELFGVIKIFQ